MDALSDSRMGRAFSHGFCACAERALERLPLVRPAARTGDIVAHFIRRLGVWARHASTRVLYSPLYETASKTINVIASSAAKAAPAKAGEAISTTRGGDCFAARLRRNILFS
jgi:hypothetical protein